MERRSFIKNTFRAIIGYALLPKCLTPAKNELSLCDKMTPAVELMPGIGGATFKMKMDCSWFEKGDIIRSSALQSDFIFTEKTEKGFKGRFLNNKEFDFIEIEHIEPVAKYHSNGHFSLETPKESKYFIGYDQSHIYQSSCGKNSSAIVSKVCSVFIEEAEIV